MRDSFIICNIQSNINDNKIATILWEKQIAMASEVFLFPENNSNKNTALITIYSYVDSNFTNIFKNNMENNMSTSFYYDNNPENEWILKKTPDNTDDYYINNDTLHSTYFMKKFYGVKDRLDEYSGLDPPSYSDSNFDDTDSDDINSDNEL
jgi:hypothetical protein